MVDTQLQIDSVMKATGAGAGVATKVKHTGFAVEDLAKRVSFPTPTIIQND